MTDLTKEELPQSFAVKYLGEREAHGLWGIRHTRRPVEALVEAAKDPLVDASPTPGVLTINSHGATLSIPKLGFPIASISYGVQDLVYTRVFAMIVVSPPSDTVPFRCHAFACESRQAARRLTYCLAAAFQEYGDRVKSLRPPEPPVYSRKYTVDLRTPEELAADYSNFDSEA